VRNKIPKMILTICAAANFIVCQLTLIIFKVNLRIRKELKVTAK